MKMSNLYAPTSKEAPSDAVLASHALLIRGGFIAQVASGLYNLLPLGKMVLNNIETIIKEELGHIGAQEVELSFVTPAELWGESGRIEKFGKELLRFKDRKDNLFVLGPTHEEMMVNLIRNKVTSYKQLPLHLYQIKTKFRDEARPRFGLMRSREFIMQDGYSFHQSYEDLDREFDAVEASYKKILDRLELSYRVVEADSGAIGGSGSKELMVLANSGEDTLVVCNSCEYGANIEAATRAKDLTDKGQSSIKLQKVHTPNIKTIDELSTYFKTTPDRIVKTVAKKIIFDDNEEIVLFFLRGDDSLQETKALNAVGGLGIVDVDEDELKAKELPAGFMGPMGELKIRMIVDNDLMSETDMICGANEVDYHYKGMDISAIQTDVYADIVEVKEGDKCPKCGGILGYKKGIEVGHIFKLGTTYSKALNAEFLNNNGQAEFFIMGTYGMGVSRLIAAIIEQHHDEKGMIWTKQSAPFVVNIMVSNIKKQEQLDFAEELYKFCQKNGINVLLDDTKERFGYKMKNAELIGFPYTVIIGKELQNGCVQLLRRESLQKTDIKKEDIFDYLLQEI